MRDPVFYVRFEPDNANYHRRTGWEFEVNERREISIADEDGGVIFDALVSDLVAILRALEAREPQ